MNLYNNSSMFNKTLPCLNQIGDISNQYKKPVHGRFKFIKHCNKILINTVKIIAAVIKLSFVFSYEVLTYPVRKWSFKRKIEKQVNNDLKSIGPEKVNEINEYFNKKISEDTINIPEKDKGICRKLVASTYASTKKEYAPVVYEWAKALLDKALVENRKLVFLARDGNAPYEVAKILKEHYPQYRDIHLSYLYLSRKVVAAATLDEGILADYAKDNGINTLDRCLFVDIGFAGSMINPIKQQLSSLHLDIQFEYLVSHTNKANGFIGDLEETGKLNSVTFAGMNRAVHWLEDTHQGVINSPKRLIRDTETGKIYPNVTPLAASSETDRVNPKSTSQNGKPLTCMEDRPLDYLCKSVATKAIKDFAEEQLTVRNLDDRIQLIGRMPDQNGDSLNVRGLDLAGRLSQRAPTKSRPRFDDTLIGSKGEQQTQLQYVIKASDRMRRKFDGFLHKILTNQRVLYIKHV